MAVRFPPSRHELVLLNDTRELSFNVQTKPIPKARPRLGRWGIYTPQRTLDYENIIAGAAAEAMALDGLEMFSCPVHVELSFAFAGRPGTVPTGHRDGDVDNLSKAVLDALNQVAWPDDRQVVAMKASKVCRDVDSVTVTVRPYVELTWTTGQLLTERVK